MGNAVYGSFDALDRLSLRISKQNIAGEVVLGGAFNAQATACKYENVLLLGEFSGLTEDQVKAKLARRLTATPWNDEASDDADVKVESSSDGSKRVGGGGSARLQGVEAWTIRLWICEGMQTACNKGVDPAERQGELTAIGININLRDKRAATHSLLSASDKPLAASQPLRFRPTPSISQWYLLQLQDSVLRLFYTLGSDLSLRPPRQNLAHLRSGVRCERGYSDRKYRSMVRNIRRNTQSISPILCPNPCEKFGYGLYVLRTSSTIFKTTNSSPG